MSCSVHDVIRIEKAGVPTVNVATKGFVDEGEAQSKLLGMPDYESLWVTHPVAILSSEQIENLAMEVADTVAARLTAWT